MHAQLLPLKQLKTCNGIHLNGLQQYLHDLQEKNIDIKKPQNLAEDYFNGHVRIPFLFRKDPQHTILASFDIFNPRKMPNE